MTELTTQETKEPYGKDFWTAIKGTWDSLNSLALAIVNAIYDAHPTEDVKKRRKLQKQF
ncbi:hypothetical protein Xbed_02864 [Xenorhabdus beddingii]|uniref:Uncharacterized protein n=1 Tax=Xenorhabdus beddingii TaxID=40578 RepID=A0A1Y2SK83_9GAMM|nr:hypothetical protein [Xenorhabdus beddingii]OTA18878.1 hypothetical protein Xbed_02864 [Xenorhabdus beddingii]